MFKARPKPSQLNTAAMSSSTENQKGGRSWKKLLRGRLPSNQQVELYQDLSLPLNIFIRCIVHSDLSGLVIQGNPKPEEVAVAWAGIYSQYIDANHENESCYILQLQADIALLTSHVSEVETCLYFLIDTFHEGLCDILKGNGYQPPTEAGDVATLERIYNQLSMRKMSLAVKTAEYNSYMEAHKADEITEKYFTTTLLRLAKYQGVAIIRSREVTVAEFVALLQDYLQSIKSEDSDGNEG